MAEKLDVKHGRSVAITALSLALGGLACSPGTDSSTAEPLQAASVRFEQNTTDEDVEVVFDITSGDQGMAELMIVGPDGRTVAVFHAPDSSTMGIRTFQFESPEPGDIEGLKAAYPAGVYRFSGKTVSGANLTAEATLSHDLPGTATFIHPAPLGEAVSSVGLEISWSAVGGVANYIVEIEQEELDINLTVRLPSTNTTFALPSGFLTPGTEYKMSVGTVTSDGNTSFMEASFTTAR